MTKLENIQGLLDAIDEHGKGLTDWEAKFVDEMLRLTDKGLLPTPPQIRIINRIFLDRAK